MDLPLRSAPNSMISKPIFINTDSGIEKMTHSETDSMGIAYT
jgi:hypothetical protein